MTMNKAACNRIVVLKKNATNASYTEHAAKE